MDSLDYRYLASLVRKAQAGDSNAFAELYVATYQQQYRYAYKYLREEELARDALQETFVQALRNIRRLRDPNLFIAWLNRINFRTCYDMKKAQHSELMDIYNEEHLAVQHSPHGRVEEEVLKIDSSEYIVRQVMNLPLTESQVILMKYYQEMKLDEIAEIMNTSRSSVKRYLRSGRNHLKKILAEFEE